MKNARGTRPTRVPRIALTGGVASGKSTVARLFTALGARLIDTDQVARDIVTPPSPLLESIVGRFGRAILRTDGTLDRAQLRGIIFADPAARRDLDSLMHPAIRKEVERLSAQVGGPYQLVAIPLLAETGTARQYDRVLLVDARPEIQRRRLMARDGMNAMEADRMLAAQATPSERRAIADDVIENEGDLHGLTAQVEAMHARYLALGSSMGDT